MRVKYEANPAGNQTVSIKFAAGVAELGDTIEVTQEEFNSVTSNGYLLIVVESKTEAPASHSPAGVASTSSTPAPSA